MKKHLLAALLIFITTVAKSQMTFTSCTCSQPFTANITPCDLDQQIISIQIVTGGSGAAINATQFKISMAGCTNGTADVTTMHIYYTGLNNSFAAINEFVAGGQASSLAVVNFNSTQALQFGTNYFWLAYDMNTSATVGNLVDGVCSNLTVAAVGHNPTTQAPAGSRTIAACTATPGANSGNIAFWVKANTGTSTTTNNASMATWSDQSGNARNATSAAANNPLFENNAADNVNFNPTIKFNGSSQYLDCANNSFAPGPNIYSIYVVAVPSSTASPGKIFATGNFGGTDDVLAMDVRATNAINHGWDNDDNIVNNQVTVGSPFLASCLNVGGANLRVTYNSGTSIASSTPVGARTNNSTTGGIGRARNPNNEYFNGKIAEIVSYDGVVHSQAQRYKTESYLAIKYGLTLSHDYMSALNTKVWNYSLDATYNNNIIGIARDDNSGLSQKQSKSTSTTADILTIYIGPSKTTNQSTNTGTFTSGDKSFFMVGNNNAAVVETTYPQTPVPAGICCRLLRQWLSQKTNFTNADLTLEFDFSTVAAQIGSLNAADIRLLIDNDGNFTNASVIGSPTISVSVAGSVVTVVVPAGTITAAQPYFTLGSVATTTPLPIDLTSFSSECAGGFNHLTWTTATETNNSFFTVERADASGIFSAVAIINGNGTTSQPHDYAWVDEEAPAGVHYYRLSQTDYNGTINQLSTITTAGCEVQSMMVYPNPVSSTTTLYCSLDEDAAFHAEVYDMLGQRVMLVSDEPELSAGPHKFTIDLSNCKSGMYLLRVEMNGKVQTYRLIKE